MYFQRKKVGPKYLQGYNRNTTGNKKLHTYGNNSKNKS